jgi:hypothetical protein
MNKRWLQVVIFSGILASAPTFADVWDTASDNDDSAGTDNLLAHGAVQVHDLGVRPGPVADQDWYLVQVPPYSSYEVQIDGMTGDVGLGVSLTRISDDGNTVLQNGTSVDGNSNGLRLAWANTTATSQLSFVRVFNPLCGTTCNSSDQYTIRARETTVAVARFNNSGSQVTVLLSQNASGGTADGYYFYWSPTGVLLQAGTLVGFPAKNLNVFPTANFGTLVGVGGHITIAHTAPYGQWNVKAVALEPATGFSFDTPGVVRP